VNLQRLDLNLLKTFEALLEERSVTAAAARLGYTQPAVSNALRRLRAQLQDPLFVRTTRGMEPTPHASRLHAPLSSALQVLRASFGHKEAFDASTSRRRFLLLTIDLGEINLLPRLAVALRRAAPGVTLATERRPYERYREALESGEADLAWGRLPKGHVDFVQQALFSDSWVCLARRGHPRVRGRLTREQFLAEQHLVVRSSFLARRIPARQVALEIANYLSVPPVLEATDLLCIVPRSLSDQFAGRYEVRALELPFRAPPSQIRQFWHKRAHHDPGHKWLRTLIAGLFTDPSGLVRRSQGATAYDGVGVRCTGSGRSGGNR
jgi:DNA-binding transcriptional LysR family regulator